MSDEEGTYTLALAFDSDDPEFTRGFAAGIIWAETANGPWEGPVDGCNAEMVMRIAEARGMRFTGVPAGDVPDESGRMVDSGWLHVRIAP